MSLRGPAVFVTGHRGMLGHVAVRVFAERGFEVLTSGLRYGAKPHDPLIRAACGSGARYIVNCLGRIKQKGSDPFDLYMGNTLFPLHLAEGMAPGQYLFHASTDCVFSGNRGNYRVDEPADASDVYGLSKRLGESVRHQGDVTVVRVSIIGPEQGPPHGLLAWFLSRPEPSEVHGYVNHRWNGITTLEWATLVADRIEAHENGEPLPSLIQPGSEPVAKAEMLRLFSEVYGTSHTIKPVEAAEAIDRTLHPTVVLPDLVTQLYRLRAWYEDTVTGGPAARQATHGVVEASR